MEYRDMTGRVIKEGDVVALRSGVKERGIDLCKVTQVSHYGIYINRTKLPMAHLRPIKNTKTVLIVTNIVDEGNYQHLLA